MKKGQIDFYYFVIAMSLLALGLIMVFSSSSESARIEWGDAYYFAKRQILFAVCGIIAMYVLSKFDYHRFGKLSFPLLIVAALLLVAVLLIGQKVKGGQRWIPIGSFSFQPSEAAKVAIILFFSHSLSKNTKVLEKFWTGFVLYLLVLGVFAGLLMKQPHFSGTVVIVLVGLILLFTAGAKTWHLLIIGLIGIAGGAGLIVSAPYRIKRVISFLDPFQDKLDSGYQIIQSLYAIGSGGLFGLGLGRSRQKFLYIPEPHNDFIFAILCEELGLVGALVTIALFGALIWRGIKIAMNAPDTFGTLIATGITALIAIEVIINIAVVTSSMPVTGMPLPFFSYGGTAMLVMMSCVGIMLNISKQGTSKGAKK
jgi:cell division protein FtsW